MSICVVCGRTESDSDCMLKLNENSYICGDCVNECYSVVQANKEVKPLEFKLMKPSELKAELDKYVIYQDKAKQSVSTAVYNHYKRISQGENKSEVEIGKSNILMIGPTGVGKTEIARVLARTLNVPFSIADATTLTQAGYVGDDVETIISRLYQASDYDVEATERGIVFIDEIDKIARKGGGNPSISRDVSGEGVQQALLKIIEGSKCYIAPEGGRKHPEQPLVEINTHNILFICSGAFEGLESIVKERMKKVSIGLTSTIKKQSDIGKDEYFNHVEYEDLIKFGLIPELIGRLPKIARLQYLNEEALKKIFIEPKNSIMKQFVEMFKLDNCELRFSDSAITEIVKMAIARGTGARGLRSIVEESLDQVMFEIPDYDIPVLEITDDVIKSKNCNLSALKEAV